MEIRQFLGLEDPAVAIEYCNFVFLWMMATITFGVGDLMTTFAIMAGYPHIIESNPIMAASVELLGYSGVVGLKLTVFMLALGVSVYSIRVWGDELLYYFPPMAISVAGAFTTAFNVRLMIGQPPNGIFSVSRILPTLVPIELITII